MNKKIVVYGSAVNFIAVVCFALSMLFGYDYASYFSSMFIAFSFVLMMCGYAYFAEKKVKLAGYVSVTFAVIYTTIILMVSRVCLYRKARRNAGFFLCPKTKREDK